MVHDLFILVEFGLLMFCRGFLHLCSGIVVQLLSCVWLFATPWTVALQVPLSSTISQSLLNFMSIEVIVSNNLILCHPAFNLSQHQDLLFQ